MTGASATGYLDAAATAPLRPEAREAMLRIWDAGPGNASSVHAYGHRAREAIDEARETIAAAFGVRPTEVVFTSGGTEANTLAVAGLALGTPRGRHLVTTGIEHSSVIESCRALQRVHGFEVSEVPVDADGRVDPARVAAELRDDTALVTIGLANGEIGTVQPVPEIADAAANVGAIMHTDAVQAAVTLPVTFTSDGWPGAGVHAASIASHKFGGPQGVGALIVRGAPTIEPILHGGGQERGARSGTENVAGIAGFAAAVAAVRRAGIGQRALALAQSRDALIEAMLTRIPGAQLTGHRTERLPGHASFVIEGVSGESVLVDLDVAGFAVSSGSACAAGSDEPSPVMLAIGVDPDLARTAIRFTLPDPLDQITIDRIVEVIARTRSHSAPSRT